ncbi:MAG: amidohydrolase [Candidatus Acidiferrum sp.]
MKRTPGLVLCALLSCIGGCKDDGPIHADRADAIYYGGPILTMNSDQPRAEAVAVKDGKIQAVGTLADIEKQHQWRKTEMVDLGGKTLIPGFFDAHSHLAQVGLQAVSANLLPPPDGPVSSIAELQQALRDYLANSPYPKKFGVLIGFDYDDSQLTEKRSPTREDLDAVSTDLPIVVIHQSGHLGAYNSKALADAGITGDTPNPMGGVIQREADGKTPNGVLEENAHIVVLLKTLPKFTPDQAIELIQAAQEIYIANGFTTAEEGRADPTTLASLIAASKEKKLKIDVVAYPDLVMNENNPVLNGPLMSRAYTDHFRLGGVKLSFDGSPQGKTAWFTKPYFVEPKGQKDDYRGYPIFAKDEEALALVIQAFRQDWQVLVHANGDAAIDQLIRVVRAAEAAVPGYDRRTVLVHGQYMRADQVKEIKDLGIFPALYPMHTFYWGDWHRQSVAGPERAENVSPTGWMVRNNMKFSIHSDAPVTLPNSLMILGTAVNRTTRTGYALGPQHRLDPMVALEAMTIWPAYQHFEENSKGSIEVGKAADLVILSDNPLGVQRQKLAEIKVIETIKGGKSLYKLDRH